jgi:prevent-host-death family protein
MVIMKRPFSPLVVGAGVLKIPATEFKAKCLAVMQAVHDGKAAEIVVTKRGKPLAKIVPYKSVDRSLFGFAAGKLRIVGDVLRTGEVWDAQQPAP